MTTWYINLFVLNKRLNEIRFVFDNILFFQNNIYLEIIESEIIELQKSVLQIAFEFLPRVVDLGEFPSEKRREILVSVHL